jgi:hypothetical protein
MAGTAMMRPCTHERIVQITEGDYGILEDYGRRQTEAAGTSPSVGMRPISKLAAQRT